MTTLKDPPRLFESLDAPAELRGWLELAHEDALPDKVALDFLDRLGPQLATPQRRPIPEQALRTLAKVRIAKRLASVLVVLGLGAAGTATVIQSARTRSTLEAVPLEHWDPRVPNVSTTHLGVANSVHLGLSQPEPLSAVLEAPAATAAASHITKVTSSVQPRRGRANSTERVPEERHVELTSSDEYRLLRAARDAVERDPARALSLVAQHARSFPKGMLGQEREAIAINALIRLGRMTEARERGSRFVRAYPGSPHAKRIEAAIKK
ncbi:MAG TPA: hypothetical protein VKP30_20775 [Polyangiaceae bacterium]|nr:hypothetical protein [Polyangiaceae bacterium]